MSKPLLLLVLVPIAVSIARPTLAVEAEVIYEGTWRTTNRKLDGAMTCVVTPLPQQKWRGHFYGVWQGVKFDYTETFEGPANALQGKATIDGAAYEWKGALNQKQFKANFSGDRYIGSFDLARKQ